MTTEADQYEFGAAPLKQEGGVYYPTPPKAGTPEWVLSVLDTATRIGADKDEPESTRYIQLSETLVNQMIAALRPEDDDAKQ